MTLKSTLGMLAKSSAEAVATLGNTNAEAKELKKYLYVKTDVEKALRSKLDETESKRIIFLCGSSGDGKSEIFRRIHSRYKDRFDFHLDATHSFDPAKNAIETLNDVFKSYSDGDRPLVVGINIGMLGNFAADGDPMHQVLTDAITGFLSGNKDTSSEFQFVSFEEFPKFDLDTESIEAPFIGPILDRICSDDERNPIYRKYKSSNGQSRIARNYRLLCLPEVRKRVCNLLFYVHLKFDQFLTARTVLDFVHQVVTGRGMLFDNLFCSQGSDLMESLSKLDPCHARSKTLDLFQVKASLGLFEPEFASFKSDLENQFGVSESEPRSWVRLFYMLQDLDISNNYHHRFRDDLRRNLFDDYRKIWQLHRDYSGDADEKKEIRKFYSKVFLHAVTSFANRFAPDLKRDRFLLDRPNGYSLSARARVEPAFNQLERKKPRNLRTFDAYLKLESQELATVPVSVSFLELVRRINRGYRPNTHDKTTVVVLEELVDEIRRAVRETEVLYVQDGHHEWSLINNHYDDEIVVEP